MSQVIPEADLVAVPPEADVAGAMQFARANGLKVSLAAIRHSMGGHAFDDNALVLDMRKFNKIEVDADARTITVQPGAVWHDIQNRLRERPFVPLRVVTGSGQAYDIRHPDLVLVGRRALIIGTASNDNPTQFETASRVAVMHVVDLQDLPTSASSESNGPAA